MFNPHQLDLINGLYEFGGGLFSLLTTKRLVKDKQVQGVSWVPFLYFFSWGIWNLIYYPNIGQVYSFLGGICLSLVSVVNLALMAYYINKVKTNNNLTKGI